MKMTTRKVETKRGRVTEKHVVGRRYYSSYWRQDYVVTHLQGAYIYCTWADGTDTVHCTPLAKSDLVYTEE